MRHRQALAIRVADKLSAALPPDEAKHEADAWMRELLRALATRRSRPLRRCLAGAAERWAARGVPATEAREALFVPFLPSELRLLDAASPVPPAQLARLNALGELAGGVAHDFNNILAAILGRTQLLLQQSSSVELRGQLRVIEQAALDGAQAVRRVQEFTRVRHDANFESLDLGRILEDALELTRPVWEEGGRRRGAAITPAVDLEARQTVAGNASELREVFTNLILNAVDAMPWGGDLRVSSRDETGNVVVRIADSGVGIPPESRPRIFDPFFTTKPGKGTGLGLSVAYGIVTRHSGSIIVESEPHLGTEFTVRLPIGQGRARPAGEEAPGRLPELRVLVVDDEPVVLEVLADLLRALGQQVTPALGGPAGREAFGRGEFDLVVSDLGMPELNGWDLALAVKSARPAVRVVLVTGWGTQLEAGAAEAHGVDRVISKPVTIADLERALRRLEAERGSRRAA